MCEWTSWHRGITAILADGALNKKLFLFVCLCFDALYNISNDKISCRNSVNTAIHGEDGNIPAGNHGKVVPGISPIPQILLKGMLTFNVLVWCFNVIV